MRVHRLDDRAHAGREQLGTGPSAVQRPAVRARPRQQVARLAELGRVRAEHPLACCDVVAEHEPHLERVGGTADHREDTDPVDGVDRGLVELGVLGQPGRDQAAAQSVLHRLAETQIGGERQRRHDLRQPRAHLGYRLDPCRRLHRPERYSQPLCAYREFSRCQLSGPGVGSLP